MSLSKHKRRRGYGPRVRAVAVAETKVEVSWTGQHPTVSFTTVERGLWFSVERGGLKFPTPPTVTWDGANGLSFDIEEVRAAGARSYVADPPRGMPEWRAGVASPSAAGRAE